ncbi:MAG: hypothetical protein RW306_07255 [Geobacteraceae bacterium]|nr:hypothetical protein [Geobacteraceae bacterium]
MTATAADVKWRFMALVSSAVTWEPEEAEAVKDAREKRRKRDLAPSSSPDEAGGRGADLVIPIIGDCPLYVDDTGTAFVWIGEKLHPLDTKNRELAEVITYQCREITGKFPSKEAVNTAISYFAEKARREGVSLELFNRVGERDGLYYYDLGNGRAVEIGPGAWRIITAPVMFRRMNHQQAQPDPLPGGDPWRFFEFCRLPKELHLLAMVTICTCFIPRISHPAIHVTGSQGAGKSFASRLLKQLVDPSAVMLSTMPRKIEDMLLLIWRYYVPIFDNVSGFNAEIGDVFCSIISGGVIEKRTLHTDSDTTIMKASGVIVFSSITSLHDRPDLHERTIKLELERIPKEERQTERRLWGEFEAALPGILGGVFDLIAKAMQIFPNVELQELPRMADYATWGYAIAEAMGGRGAGFMIDYTGNATLATADLLEHNTFFSSIVQAMERPGPGGLSGTFKEILCELLEIAAPGGSGARALEKDRSFPSSPRSFRKHLERLKVPLEDMGITYTIDNHRTNKGRAAVEFRKRDPEPKQNTAPDQEAPDLDDMVFEEGEIF